MGAGGLLPLFCRDHSVARLVLAVFPGNGEDWQFLRLFLFVLPISSLISTIPLQLDEAIVHFHQLGIIGLRAVQWVHLNKPAHMVGNEGISLYLCKSGFFFPLFGGCFGYLPREHARIA
jgi:hypothetical protein